MLRGLTLTPPSATVVVLDLLYYKVKSHLLRIKCVFKHHDLHMFGLKIKQNIGNSQSEIVGRGRSR